MKVDQHLLGGALGGTSSCLILQPLDVIKTRQQQNVNATLKSIFKSTKIIEFWRGTTPTILRNVPGSALYFLSLNKLKTFLSNNHLTDTKNNFKFNKDFINLFSGAFCRTTIGFIMMPISVIKVRYESNLYNYKSISSAFSNIIKTEGWKGLFSGFGATAARDAPFAGFYVFSYENCKTILPKFNINDSTLVSAGSGLISGLFACSLTHPFDFIKTRVQLKPEKYPNSFVAFKKILLTEGFKSMFTGFLPRTLRKTVSSAITWTVYEEYCKWSR